MLQPIVRVRDARGATRAKVNDLFGPGDAVDLVVRFGPDGRVVRVSTPLLAD